MYKNPDGTETEVFTKDEVDTQVKNAKDEATKSAGDAAAETIKKASEDAVNKYKEDHPDKAQEIKDLESKLSDAEEKLKTAEGDDGGDDKNKDEQVSRLKKAKEEIEETLGGKITELTNKVEGMVGDKKSNLIKKLSNGDDEMAKKIEFEFDNYRSSETSESAIQERMEKAYTLVTGKNDAPGILDGTISAGDRGSANLGDEANKEKMPDSAKSMGKNLGISEKDIETFGPGGEKDPSKK